MKSQKQVTRTQARAALYMRVSTGRQAEHDLSIPDQRQQLQSWCRGHGHAVTAEFVEAGASATDDRRPVFQQMIERACDGGNAFDVIIVHSYSRFFREAFLLDRRGSPLLHLLYMCPEGKDGVQGTLDPDGQTRWACH